MTPERLAVLRTWVIDQTHDPMHLTRAAQVAEELLAEVDRLRFALGAVTVERDGIYQHEIHLTNQITELRAELATAKADALREAAEEMNCGDDADLLDAKASILDPQ